MQNPSSTKSSKVGYLYRAVYIERFVAVVEETDLTIKLWFYPTNSFAQVAKAEFLAAIEQNQFEFIEQMPYDIVQSINSGPNKEQKLKYAYDDYHRRKQFIISSEL
jgi:hypothetical protein